MNKKLILFFFMLLCRISEDKGQRKQNNKNLVNKKIKIYCMYIFVFIRE